MILGKYLPGLVEELQITDFACYIEENYVDRDFLIDYSNYYSRCHTDIGRFTTRIHFFSVSASDLSLYLNDFTNGQKILQENYIGFIVLKPNKIGSIGKSLLRPYPEKVLNNYSDKRIINTLRKYEVNFFGYPLSIRTLAFQEQDSAVAACATTSVWTALSGLENIFNNTRNKSPSEITALALKHCPIGYPQYPSRGLSIYQVCSVINHLGYEVSCHSISKDHLFTHTLLKAYIKYGIPIIAKIDLLHESCTSNFSINDSNKDENADPSYHTAVITGYKEDSSTKMIKELYLHDDQIGPFSRASLIEGSCLELSNEWSDLGDFVSARIEKLLIPLYHKIRLDYFQVFSLAKSIQDTEIDFEDYNFEILLFDVNKYKFELRKYFEKQFLVNINGTDYNILYKSLPKYFWVIRMYTHLSNKEVISANYDIIIDATIKPNKKSKLNDFIIVRNHASLEIDIDD